MPFRRIDLLAEDLTIDAVRTALDDAEVDDLYLIKRDDGLLQASIVLDERLAEHAIDVLTDNFGDHERFNLLIYQVAARVTPKGSNETDDEIKQHDHARDRISRDELIDDLSAGGEVSRIYLAQVVISCVVAAVGMIRNSTAMVIGGMVIAPLLLPSMSMALGTTIGDLKMIFRSVYASLAGVVLGFVVSLAIGLVVVFDPQVEQLAMRSETKFSDIAVALAAGAAGAIAVTTGVSPALIGVMVAVALVPPLVACGLLLGTGEYAAASGALILVVTNIVCVNLAAVGVFLIQGIRPTHYEDKARAKKAVINAGIVWGILLLGLVLLIAFAAPTNPLK
ncbi:MAG: TIGR00341 family protein [Phycisphaeraceae bacterium]